MILGDDGHVELAAMKLKSQGQDIRIRWIAGSDLWASQAVLIGISLVAIFNFQIADPLAGIAVAIIIGTTAIEQGRRTTQVLLDAMSHRQTLAAIERILESDPRLHGYHALRARQAGNHVLLDVSVHVDGNLSLAQAHKVAHAVSERIQ